MKTYHEKVFEEIANLIVDNLELLYNYNDNALINIRKYCYEHAHKKYVPLDNDTLIYFVEETLVELINCDFLYDFRDMD